MLSKEEIDYYTREAKDYFITGEDYSFNGRIYETEYEFANDYFVNDWVVEDYNASYSPGREWLEIQFLNKKTGKMETCCVAGFPEEDYEETMKVIERLKKISKKVYPWKLKIER